MQQRAMNADWPISDLFFGRRIDLTILRSTMSYLLFGALVTVKSVQPAIALWVQPTPRVWQVPGSRVARDPYRLILVVRRS